MLEQAVILAGGFGTRLGHLTQHTPKPLLDVGGAPFLSYIFWNLCRYGIRRVVLSIGYLAEQIQEVLGDGSRFGLELHYVVETESLGTGGGLKAAAGFLDGTFLALNGDTIFDINYLDLALRLRSDNLAVVALRQVADAARYGHVKLIGEQIETFCEKGPPGPGLISGGVYAMKKESLSILPEGKSSIEQDLFPRLAEYGKLGGMPSRGFFLDIGLPETYNSAQTLLPAWKRRPAAFLDRDGVLNLDHGYVHKITDFDWVDGAKEAVKLLNDAGYLVILVTNQSGLGRGYYREEDFWRLTSWMQCELARVGAHLDGVYFCPHHPTEGKGLFKKACRCRKPNPGMIEQALKEWSVDMNKSFVIGDKAKDMELAASLNVPGYCFRGGNLLEFVKKARCVAPGDSE